MDNFDKHYNEIYSSICESTSRNYEVEHAQLSESLSDIPPSVWMDMDWVVGNASPVSGKGFGGKRYFRGPLGGWYRINHWDRGNPSTIRTSTVKVEDPDLIQKLNDTGPSSSHPGHTAFGLGSAGRAVKKGTSSVADKIRRAYDSPAGQNVRTDIKRAASAGADGMKAGARHLATSTSPFASSLRAGTYGGAGIGAIAGLLSSKDKEKFIDKIKHIAKLGATGSVYGAGIGATTAGYKSLKNLE